MPPSPRGATERAYVPACPASRPASRAEPTRALRGAGRRRTCPDRVLVGKDEMRRRRRLSYRFRSPGRPRPRAPPPVCQAQGKGFGMASTDSLSLSCKKSDASSVISFVRKLWRWISWMVVDVLWARGRHRTAMNLAERLGREERREKRARRRAEAKAAEAAEAGKPAPPSRVNNTPTRLPTAEALLPALALHEPPLTPSPSPARRERVARASLEPGEGLPSGRFINQMHCKPLAINALHEPAYRTVSASKSAPSFSPQS